MVMAIGPSSFVLSSSISPLRSLVILLTFRV